MSVSEIEVLHSIQTGNGNNYLQLSSADPEFNHEKISVIAASDSHPRMVASNGRRIGIPFATQQLATAIAEHGNLGANVSQTSGLKLFYRTYEKLAGRVIHTAQRHTRFTCMNAYSHILSISAGHRKDAEARCRVIPVRDATNEAMIRTGTANLTIAPSANQIYTLGSIMSKYVTGTPVTKIFEGCDDLEVNLNPEPLEIADQSDVDSTFAAGDTITPVLSFTTTDRWAMDFDCRPVEDFRFHLLRKKKSGKRYEDIETQHIRGTVYSGLFTVQSISGRPSMKRVELHAAGRDSGLWTDQPIVWDINVAVNNV